MSDITTPNGIEKKPRKKRSPSSYGLFSITTPTEGVTGICTDTAFVLISDGHKSPQAAEKTVANVEGEYMVARIHSKFRIEIESKPVVKKVRM